MTNAIHSFTDRLGSLWIQLSGVVVCLASAGLVHGDLSAYTLLVAPGRLLFTGPEQLFVTAAAHAV